MHISVLGPATAWLKAVTFAIMSYKQEKNKHIGKNQS